MAQVICEEVSRGLREAEAIAVIKDIYGRRHYIRVERDFLRTGPDGNYYLPVGVVHVDAKTRAVLIELPHEAETGANRLWIPFSAFLEPVEASA